MTKLPYFISDTHFLHSKIIEYCKRPFTTADEMDAVLIDNWNNSIGSQDTVYFLGDLAFAKPDKIKEILKVLNGNIFLIKGNHDWNLSSLHNYFTDVRDLITIEIPDSDMERGVQPIVLCHYPLERWDRMHYGSWMLHGHVHGSLPYNPKLKRLDVGVDTNNFKPLTYNEIKLKLGGSNV